MSITSLFDHRAECWRPVERRGFGAQVKPGFEAVERPASGLNCAIDGLVGRSGEVGVQDIGPGEARRGRTQAFLPAAFNVEERDILRLVAGPEAPSLWRVMGVARPRGHHTEADVEPWAGEIPEVA